MSDVRLQGTFAQYILTMDWLLRDTGELDEREEFASSVRVALGTDRMADADEVLPDPDSTDRRGWWGDYQAEEIWGGWPIGTKNWLLSRAKISDALSEEGSTLDRARQYTLDALQPFIDRGMASSCAAEVTRTDLDRIDVRAGIYRGPLLEIDLRYQLLWENIDDAS